MEKAKQYKEIIKKRDNNKSLKIQNENNKYYSAGMKEYKLRNWEKAIYYLEKSIEQEREYYKAVFIIGKCYSRINDKIKAEESYKRVIELNKVDMHARVELGKLYASQGKEVEAEESYKRVIELDKLNVHARTELGRLYASQGKKEEAEKMYKEVVELNKADIPVRTELEKLYVNQNTLLLEIRTKIHEDKVSQEDIKTLKKMLEEGNNDEKYRYSLAVVAIYEKLGQYKQALDMIKQIKADRNGSKELNIIEQRLKSSKRKIFDLKSWDNLIQWGIVGVKIKDEKIEEKAKIVESVEEENQEKIKKTEQNSNNNNNSGEEKKKRKIYSADYKKQIQERLKKESAYNIAKDVGIPVGTVYYWKRELNKQIDTNENTEKEPKVLEVNNVKFNNKAYFQGIKEYKAGNLRNAIQYLETSLEQEEDYMTALMLGKCYSQIKDLQKAEQLFIRAIELNKNNIQAKAELARLYASQGKAKKAEQLYEETIELDEKNEIQYQSVQIRIELGKLYAKQGKQKKAEQLYKKAYELKDRKQVIEALEKKIYQALPKEVLDAIQKIEQKYYMKMQDTNTTNIYTKKINKLKLLLKKGNSNKRAKAEIMLIMINEGFKETIKRNYPTEYEFIKGLIQEYKAKNIDAETVQEKIAEYCM